MRLSVIAAVAENDVIGAKGKLPWHLPADLKRFKALTMGHAVIMGRKTFESIGRPLPGRRNIVLSRDGAYRAEGVEVAASLEAAIARCDQEDEVFVIGGASLFREALTRADRLYLTRVRATVPGDVHFPAWNENDWSLEEEEAHPADAAHAHGYRFLTFARVR